MFAVRAARLLCWYQNSSHRSVSIWNTFFFLWQFLKRLKNMQSKISLQIEIKVQVSPIHRYTAVDILLFLFSGWVLKSSSLKVLYSLADVVRGEPLQRAWIISKLITIWFWSHFSLFFSYHWYFNWSIYVRSPSFLYYLRSALTYVGIYPPPLVWNFSGSLPFILVLSQQLIDMVLNVQQCKSIHQCKHQGKKLQKIFRVIWEGDLMLFATLSQTLSLFCNSITFCKKCMN